MLAKTNTATNVRYFEKLIDLNIKLKSGKFQPNTALLEEKLHQRKEEKFEDKSINFQVLQQYLHGKQSINLSIQLTQKDRR